MNFKKSIILGIALLFVLLMSATAFPNVVNPNTIIQVTEGGIVSLDPFWPYSPPSNNVDFQIYESLVQYDGPSTTRFLPMLSTNVPSVKDGTIQDNGKTYIFHIRKKVYFHNGDLLTPEDVKYSLERQIVFDRSGGPSWMIAMPLIGVNSIEDLVTKYVGVSKYSALFSDGVLKPEYKDAMLKAFAVLDKSIEIKGDDVIIHMPKPYPSLISIVAHGICGSYIIDKKWAVDNGAWPGTADTWWKYHNPVREKDPLYSIANGTGPYKLVKWERGIEVTLKRFDNYWRAPAKVENIIIKVVKEFTTRKLMLQHGDADIAAIPQQYLSLVKNIPGVKVFEKLPILGVDAGFMTYTINMNGNPYVGSGKLDGNGIPSNFFSDINVRKAFSYMFPYDLYIKEVWNGNALQPNGPIPKGIFGYDPTVPKYHFDLAKSEEYFKKAFNGELWKKGFKMSIVYITGAAQSRQVANMLSAYARKINPRFKIEVRSELWSSYVRDRLEWKLPYFMTGWFADYPDADDFVYPFLYSTGYYGLTLGKGYQELAKKVFDPLIDEARSITNIQERLKIYKELSVKAYDEAAIMWLYQPLGNHVQRSWIKGWYYNPMLRGMIDFYALSK